MRNAADGRDDRRHDPELRRRDNDRDQVDERDVPKRKE